MQKSRTICLRGSDCKLLLKYVKDFSVAPRTIEYVTMREIHKDEDDPSPFPALSQLEIWGYETKEA